ncbi:MAG: ribonuclease P protein component [Candidatus Omnitrophica bacterium]|nr:ribonuclease P protein component [Candidatus Omnitrophota bacterium]
MYRRGRLARGRAVWVYLLPRDDKKVRLGVSVSRKVAKRPLTGISSKGALRSLCAVGQKVLHLVMIRLWL